MLGPSGNVSPVPVGDRKHSLMVTLPAVVDRLAHDASASNLGTGHAFSSISYICSGLRIGGDLSNNSGLEDTPDVGPIGNKETAVGLPVHIHKRLPDQCFKVGPINVLAAEE